MSDNQIPPVPSIDDLHKAAEKCALKYVFPTQRSGVGADQTEYRHPLLLAIDALADRARLLAKEPARRTNWPFPPKPDVLEEPFANMVTVDKSEVLRSDPSLISPWPFPLGGPDMGKSRINRPVVKPEIKIVDAVDVLPIKRKRDPYQGHAPGAFPSTTFQQQAKTMKQEMMDEDAATERKSDAYDPDAEACDRGIQASLSGEEDLQPDDYDQVQADIDSRDDGTEGHGPEDEA